MVKRVLILALASCALAGCQSSVATGPIAWNSPLVVPVPATPSATSSMPAPGTHIQWNAPTEVPDGGSSSNAPPLASEARPNPAPAAPGSTIHWNSNGTEATVGAPPSSSSPPEQVSPPPPGTVATIPPPVPLTPAQPGPDIRWRTAVQGDEVRVEIVDPASQYRGQQVMLVSPSGQEIAAKDITRYTANTDVPYYSDRPTFGIGGFGGSRSGVSLGIGTVFPLGSSPPPPEDFDQRYERTVAVVYLPDPKAYQRNADRWSVRARLLDPAQVAYTVTFPAPRPPNS
jgi:hypothetical protein